MDYKEYFEKKLTDEEILRCFRVVMPYLNELMMNDCTVALTNTEKGIFASNAEHSFYCGPENEQLIEVVKKCMDANKPQTELIDKEVYGKEFKVIAVPIKNSKNEIIGSISNGINTTGNSKLLENINSLNNIITDVSENTHQIANASVGLAEHQQNVMKLTQETVETVSETDKVLELIKSIANQTNLLGLNAAIEAARAGENGKGFSVVAAEVRKLANQSKESVSTIKDILDKVNESMDKISKAIEETAAISQEQAASTEEINASIDNITNSVKNLKEFSKELY
ncbi:MULTISPECIES: methyl-accepting chemotaxis protein [Clostridium]|uniref:methyl-accepting chemotaxis protein n=1 Tax=Clostridium TaxID=1485 RepID=UPI00069F50A2|nr:methyl-accepting chemotaxis protein [Clostridium sp. DMHC 10]KOF57396.1 hypothetical protein AGR56_13375 [Clostridium sp. DMHC 10]